MKKLSTKLENKFVGAIINRPNGITLISLVVTIVVLIILAGVTINMTLGENGIFNKAKEAKKAQIIATTKEQIGTEILAAQMDAIERNEELEQSQVEDIISNYGELQEDKDTIILNDSGYEVSLKDIYNETQKSEITSNTFLQRASTILKSYEGDIHPGAHNDTSILNGIDTTKSCWVKGKITCIYELSSPKSIKLIESYQPNISLGFAVGGNTSFALYGSNDDSTWSEIQTYIACKQETVGSWYSLPMTTHITRVDNGNYSVPAYKYYKIVADSYYEWLDYGVHFFYY